MASQFTVSVSSENEESGDEVYASFSHLSFSDSDSFIEKYNFALPRHNSPWSSVNGHAPQTSDSHESEASRSTASTQNSSSSSEHASVVNESLSSGSYESIILSPASSFEDMDFVSENRSFVRRPLELPQDIQNRDYYVRLWVYFTSLGLLRWIDTFSRETFLPTLFLLHSEKGLILKRKNLLHLRANGFLLE